ncbi:MAG: hypothetical protein HYV60_15555 [Planctomycetia bacterium]|nr:hypothetical protein [Planctomycetia bacterium]
MQISCDTLLVWILLTCISSPNSFAEQTAPTGAADEILFPRLAFEVIDDGRLQRSLTQERCPDLGHIWARFLRDAAVRKELELLDDQWNEFVEIARSADGDAEKYRETVNDVLLPHQLDQLQQLIRRYECLATGVLHQLQTNPAFSLQPVSDQELQRIAVSLDVITRNFHATSEQELKALDLEVRKTLTREQLESIHALIGDHKVLEGPFLDFAILKLQTIADLQSDRLDKHLDAKAAALGRSTKHQLTVNGHLETTKNDTPMHFFAAFRNGITRAGLNLDAEQRDLLRDFEQNLITEVSGKSKRVYRLITEDKLTLDEAKEILTGLAEREINRTVNAFETLLSREQQDQLNRYVQQRELAQRGLLPLLVEGKRAGLSEEQRSKALDIVRQREEQFREITRRTEAEIWDAVKTAIPPRHRASWTQAYGEGAFKSLPTSPILLLYRTQRKTLP